MMKMTPSYILLVYMFVVVSGDVPYEHINGKCNGTDYNSNSIIIYVVNNAILECI
ncbi:CrmD [Cowpox virus]|uniref:CrmD n=1 Tax=Cowpox virus TaxID=10243 RepID=A0A212QCN7_COWPX|nr:CrmD [Cowpox virus]